MKPANNDVVSGSNLRAGRDVERSRVTENAERYFLRFTHGTFVSGDENREGTVFLRGSRDQSGIGIDRQALRQIVRGVAGHGKSKATW